MSLAVLQHHYTSRIVMKIPMATPMTAVLIGIVIVLGACSARHSAGPTVTPEPARQSSRPPRTLSSEGWNPTLIAAKRRYTITDSSTISISGDSTHLSAIETGTVFSILTTQAGDSFRLHMSVDSILTTTHVPAAKIVVDTSMIGQFDGVLTANGKVSALIGRRSTTCVGGIDPVATRIFELTIIFAKKRMNVGDSWSDTLSTTTCRGKAPLRQQTTRRYEILDIPTGQQNTSVKIRRIVSTLFTGMSPDMKNHLSINGSGSATAELSLEPRTGSLLQSDGISETTLVVVTSRGSFPFKQIVITHIRSLEQ